MTELLIIALAVAGFALCLYINSTKRKGKKLVCPMDGACDFVTRSEYSVILGINAEVLGMIYYAAITLLLLASAVFQSSLHTYAVLAAVALSAAGFLMSLYFMWLQFAVIRRWCTLCAASAILSTLIFVFSVCAFWLTIVFFFAS